MKHRHNHDNAWSANPQSVPVLFEFTDPAATTVCSAGTFNNWKPENKSLHSSRVGNWWKDTVFAPGTYEYCRVVDSKYVPDPLANQSGPNPFGGRNLFLAVFSSPVGKHLADAENVRLINANKPSSRKK